MSVCQRHVVASSHVPFTACPSVEDINSLYELIETSPKAMEVVAIFLLEHHFVDRDLLYFAETCFCYMLGTYDPVTAINGLLVILYVGHSQRQSGIFVRCRVHLSKRQRQSEVKRRGKLHYESVEVSEKPMEVVAIPLMEHHYVERDLLCLVEACPAHLLGIYVCVSAAYDMDRMEG